jgi:hypothetical protein
MPTPLIAVRSTRRAGTLRRFLEPGRRRSSALSLRGPLEALMIPILRRRQPRSATATCSPQSEQVCVDRATSLPCPQLTRCAKVSAPQPGDFPRAGCVASRHRLPAAVPQASTGNPVYPGLGAIGVHTMGEAARACGKSKPAIAKAIKTGRISATRAEDGSYRIDPAELHQVYPMNGQLSGQGMRENTPADSPVDSGLLVELAKWRVLAEEPGEVIRDLRGRLDASEDERRRVQERLTGLLTHRPAGSVLVAMPGAPAPGAVGCGSRGGDWFK